MTHAELTVVLGELKSLSAQGEKKKVSDILAMQLSGDSMRFMRQALWGELTGSNRPVAKCGVNAILTELMKLHVVENVAAESAQAAIVPASDELNLGEVEAPANEVTAEVAKETAKDEQRKVKALTVKHDRNGLTIAYRADLTEEIAETVKDFQSWAAFLEKHKEAFATTVGLVSRGLPIFSQDFAYNVIWDWKGGKVNPTVEQFVKGYECDTEAETFKAIATMEELLAFLTAHKEAKIFNSKGIEFVHDWKEGILLNYPKGAPNRSYFHNMTKFFAVVEMVEKS